MSHEANIRRLLQVNKTMAGARRPAARIQRPGKDAPAPKTGYGNRAPPRPDKAENKPGLTLAQLFAATKKNWPDRVDNAKRDKVTVVRLGVPTRQPNTIYTETLTYDNSSKIPQIRRHKQYVKKRVLARGDDNQLLPFTRAKVIVSCECDDFKFTFEYVLVENGAAKTTYSNAEFPIIKNPNMLIGGCKHCVVAWNAIAKKRL